MPNKDFGKALASALGTGTRRTAPTRTTRTERPVYLTEIGPDYVEPVGGRAGFAASMTEAESFARGRRLVRTGGPGGKGHPVTIEAAETFGENIDPFVVAVHPARRQK